MVIRESCARVLALRRRRKARTVQWEPRPHGPVQSSVSLWGLLKGFVRVHKGFNVRSSLPCMSREETS